MAKLDFAFWDVVAGPPQNAQTTADVFDEHIRLAQHIEELGWHSYFIIEHQNTRRRFTTSTCLSDRGARATSRMRIGAMMWQLPSTTRFGLRRSGMLDQLSRGRVEFGTGIGVHEHEFIRWGMDYYQRAAMRRILKIVKMAWTQHEVTSTASTSTSTKRCRSRVPTSSPIHRFGPPCIATPPMEFAARNNYNVSQNLDTDEAVARKFDLYRSCGRNRSTRTDAAHFLQRQISSPTRTKGARGGAQVHRHVRRRPRRRRYRGGGICSSKTS